MRKIVVFLLMLISSVYLGACEFNFVLPTVPNNECDHNYVEQIIKDATCEEEGVVKYFCDICGDTYSSVIEVIEHEYVDNNCIYCGESESSSEGINAYLIELFGDNVEVYTDDERNPYGVDLSKYGDDVIAVFYNPDFTKHNDPYINVDKNEFYENY